MRDPEPRLALREGPGLVSVGLADRYLTEYLDKIELAVGALDETQVWARATADANSIGNLILHLCGNLSLWVRASLGGRRYVRDRAAEFAADRICTKEELLEALRDVVEDSRTVIRGLDPVRVEEVLEIQGYRTDGRGAVFHAVEHMSYHTGQIVLLAKQALAGVTTLEFYPQHRRE